MLKKLISFFLFTAILFLQSCTTIKNNDHIIQKQVEGRFSLALTRYNQSTQGRFLWKISKKNNSEIEEFYLMDPWGKTRGILLRNVDSKDNTWVLLRPDRRVIKDKYVENWLKKVLDLPSVELSALNLPIGAASTKLKKYFQKKNKIPFIKIVSNTNLGKITISVLPD